MPKKLFLSVIFIGFTLYYGNAQTSNSNLATVYFMRSTGTVGLGAFNVFIDDALICKLNNNCYTVHSVDKGLHKFLVQADGRKAKKGIKALDLQIEPGQTYYISVDATNHVHAATIFLMEVTINTANKMLPVLKEDNNCK